MPLDERYFIAAPLDQYFVDKDTGLPLANGTIQFFRDKARATGKDVYRLTGAPDPDTYSYTSIGSTITLSSAGTIVEGNNNIVIYFYPYDSNGNLDLYYIRCFNADGVEQWSREGWPNVNADNDPTQDSAPVPNQIANPQFTRHFLNTGTTTLVTGSGTNSYQIAPDWFLEVDGIGSIQLSVEALQVGANIPSRPPYALDILIPQTVSGCRLVQRLNNNAGLWSSTSTNDLFITGAFSAENQAVSGTVGVSMFYRDASGINFTAPVQIANGTITTAWANVTGNSGKIPTSTSALTGENGYVDIYLDLPPGSHLRVTSIQAIPTNAGGNIIAYDSQSSNRALANMSDYYNVAFERKYQKSMLQCWDFPRNPQQFTVVAGSNFNNVPIYIMDQTIAYNSNANNVAFARYQPNGINALQFTTSANTNETFLLCQYLENDDINPILSGKMSLNINAWSTNANNVVCRAYLYRAGTTGTFPVLSSKADNYAAPAVGVANQYLLGDLTTTAGDDLGVFTLDTVTPAKGQNWTEISRSNLGNPKFTLNQSATLVDQHSFDHDFGFSQYEITNEAQLQDTNKFAIVVTFACPTASTVVVVNSISLVPGDIPTRPAIQSEQEVLSDAQKYYETSLDVGKYWTTFVQADGGITYGETAGGGGGNLDVLNSVKFNVEKRIIPAVHQVRSIQGTLSNISNLGLSPYPGTEEAIGGLNIINKGKKYFGIINGGIPTGGAQMAFRWLVDARIG